LGGTLSLGVGPYKSLDTENWDNGTYIIDNWEIVEREYFDGQEQAHYDADNTIKEIRAINDKIFNYKEDNVSEIHVFR